MKDVMIDLETLGTRPGSVILSLGATFFSPTDLGEKFYMVISQASSRLHNLSIDQRTLDWWTQQSPAARQVLDDSNDLDKAKTVTQVLDAFNSYLGASDVRVWGNGATFDNVLLRSAYEAANVKPRWSHRADMCYRTLKNLFPQVEPQKRQGVFHHAMDDAIYQAVHAGAILRGIK